MRTAAVVESETMRGLTATSCNRLCKLAETYSCPGRFSIPSCGGRWLWREFVGVKALAAGTTKVAEAERLSR